MSTLKLWAIGIDEVRRISGADQATAERLRRVADERFAVSQPRRPGLLGKLGPLMRGGGDPAAPRPGSPTAADVDDLLAGRFIDPPRLDRAWLLLELWLDTLSLGTDQWSVGPGGLDDFDFDLARAQAPGRCGLTELFKASLGLSLTRPPGLAAGWVPGRHADTMNRAWQPAIAELSAEHAELATAIGGWLGHFTTWRDQAVSSGRPEPDLVAVFRS